MTRLVTVSWGPDQFRFGPWHGDTSTAYVTVSPRVRAPTSGGVDLLVDQLRSKGYDRAVTAALRNHEVAAFTAAGFAERERLVVLSHDLADLPPAPRVGHRRARRGDREGVLRVDGSSFDPAWSLDPDGLAEALGATPRARYRVIDGVPIENVDRGIVAYAICGRSGRIGYLQRLAVDPAAQGRGFGQALVVDALAWVRRRGGRLAMVNTQQSNTAALALYRRLGFRHEPSELTVLTRELSS